MCKNNPSCLNPSTSCNCIENNDENEYCNIEAPPPPSLPCPPSFSKYRCSDCFVKCFCCKSFNRFKQCNINESPALPCHIKCDQSCHCKRVTKFPCPPNQPRCPIKCHSCYMKQCEGSEECESDSDSDCESKSEDNHKERSKRVYKINIKEKSRDIFDILNIF